MQIFYFIDTSVELPTNSTPTSTSTVSHSAPTESQSTPTPSNTPAVGFPSSQPPPSAGTQVIN